MLYIHTYIHTYIQISLAGRCGVCALCTYPFPISPLLSVIPLSVCLFVWVGTTLLLLSIRPFLTYLPTSVDISL